MKQHQNAHACTFEKPDQNQRELKDITIIKPLRTKLVPEKSPKVRQSKEKGHDSVDASLFSELLRHLASLLHL